MDPRALFRKHRPVRRAILGALIGAWSVTASFAQVNTEPNWMPYADSIGTALKLTPEQRKGMEDLDKRYQAQYEALGNDGLRQKQLPTMRAQRDRDIQGMLGAKQYQQWQQRDQHFVPGTAQPLPANGGQPGVNQQGPPTLPPPPPTTPTPGTPMK